jgi:galactose mutarotase-like enzyme
LALKTNVPKGINEAMMPINVANHPIFLRRKYATKITTKAKNNAP